MSSSSSTLETASGVPEKYNVKVITYKIGKYKKKKRESQIKIVTRQ